MNVEEVKTVISEMKFKRTKLSGMLTMLPMVGDKPTQAILKHVGELMKAVEECIQDWEFQLKKAVDD